VKGGQHPSPCGLHFPFSMLEGMRHAPGSLYLSVLTPSACAKRLLPQVGQKHQGYNGAVVPAVAQGIYGGDLLASCHWVICLNTHVH
jgi:hypothetical protein